MKYPVISRLFKNSLSKIEQKIDDMIQQAPAFKEKEKELLSISGMGSKRAHNTVAWVPEGGTLNRRQIARLWGVAPHPKQSGTSQGYRP